MYLLVKTNGAKLWRFDYRFSNNRKTLSLGVYPDVTLKSARIRLSENRELLANGIDPGIHRRIQKTTTEKNSFKAVGSEWFAKNSPVWSESHCSRVTRLLEKDIYPWLGSQQIGDIKALEVLDVMRRVESRGAVETARRVHQTCGQVFRYAVATGRAERDPSADLKGVLSSYME